MKILGLILIVLGALALYFKAIPYTSREKVVDLGPIHASADVERNVPLPPWVGGGLIALGVLLVAAPAGRRR